MTMRSSAMLGMMIVAAIGMAPTVHAQTTSAAVDSAPYVQARDMVSNGEVEEGHRMVDSLLKAATPGTPAYAEGLYWRAAISQNARDAERDYRQVVVDYPLSRRVPDALLRLGQLEAARGDRDAALQHFQRVVLEYPDSPLRANASYWVANTYLAKNDLQRGCTANADALARVASTNVELKNRIDFQQLRCRGVQVASATPATAAPTTPRAATTATTATTTEKRTSATREVPVAESRAAADTPTVAAKSESTAVAARASDSAATEPAESTATKHVASSKSTTAAKTTKAVKGAKATKAVPAKSAKSANSANSARSASTKVVKTTRQADSVKATSAAESTVVSTRATTRTTSASAAPATSARGYAVQVAAYTSRMQADSLAAKLRARGYPSHVDGDTTPYRVRIGHYHTHADAAAVLKQLKAKKIDGFVTEF